MDNKIDWVDAVELAANLCGLDDNYDSNDVDEALFDKFEISFEQFHTIVNMLAPLARISKSELTGSIYAGFVIDGYFVAKVQLPEGA